MKLQVKDLQGSSSGGKKKMKKSKEKLTCAAVTEDMTNVPGSSDARTLQSGAKLR